MTPSNCPKCHSPMVRRSQRSTGERVVGFLPFRPFRCRHCRNRFWRPAAPTVSLPALVGFLCVLLVGSWVGRQVYQVIEEERRLEELGRQAIARPATPVNVPQAFPQDSPRERPRPSLTEALDGPEADAWDEEGDFVASAPGANGSVELLAVEMVTGGRGVAVRLRTAGQASSRRSSADSIANGRGLWFPGSWDGLSKQTLQLEHPLAESVTIERRASGLQVLFSPRPEGASLALAEASAAGDGIVVRLRPYP
ncbi:MAG: hypothetical protein AAGD01_15225 [Acidobacteriota bacterium]